MNAPTIISLPTSLFLQQYAVIAQQLNLVQLSEDTQILYVPPHAVISDVIYVQPEGDLCVVVGEYARVNSVFDQTNVQKSVRFARLPEFDKIVCESTPGCEREFKVTLYAHQNASLTYTLISTGNATHHIELHPLGHDATIAVYGIYGITDTQRCIITTRQEHMVPGATSSVLIKGIVGGNAVAEYTGMITIANQAAQTNATQQAATVLVSPQARARAIPSLQVLTNDVRCKHGSAVGQLDQEQVWYAQARGISQERATHMLLQGFLQEVITHVPGEQAGRIVSDVITFVMG